MTKQLKRIDSFLQTIEESNGSLEALLIPISGGNDDQANTGNCICNGACTNRGAATCRGLNQECTNFVTCGLSSNAVKCTNYDKINSALTCMETNYQYGC